MEPGTGLATVALVVMATSGIRAFFNLNPLIKLDGYYLLSDAVGIPNLRKRALAYVAARMRRLGRSPAPGTEDVTPRERRIYLAYGLLAGAFSFLMLGFIALRFGGFLMGRYQGLGFVIFTALLLVVFRKPLVKALPAPPAELVELARSRLGSVSRRAKVLGALPALLGLLLLGRMELTVSGEFTFLPAHNADVRAQVEGIIEEIHVEEGARVGEGDPIASLFDADYRAQLQKVRSKSLETRARHEMLLAGPTPEEVELAEAAVDKARERLKYAKSELERADALYARQLSSQREFKRAEEERAVRSRELGEARGRLRVLLAGSRREEIEALEAELAGIEAEQRYLEEQLEHVRVLSPLSGIVTTPKLKERLGEHVAKGDLIAEVYDLRRVSAEIAISEKDIGDVSLGQEVVLKARAYPGKSFSGRVSAIAPAAVEDEGGRGTVIHVKTEIENPSLLLKPQMTGTAKILCGKRQLFQLIFRRVLRYVRVEFWSWW